MSPAAACCLSCMLVFAAGCDESTSGADRIATLPAADAGTGTGADTGTGDLAAAIASRAQTECAGFAHCLPQTLQAAYGTQAECEARDVVFLSWLATLPGSGVDGAALLACRDMLAAETCTEWASSTTDLPACDYRGHLPVGSPCLDGSQCATGFCPSVGYACSNCATAPATGAPCAGGAVCGPGMVCSGATTCAVAAGMGQACSAAQPCDTPLVCVGNVCQTLPTAAGAPCIDLQCSLEAQLVCESTGGTCVPIEWVGDGASCGLISGTGHLCMGSGSCLSGTCRPPASDGQACDDSAGPYCEWPDVCESGRCVGPTSAGACP